MSKHPNNAPVHSEASPSHAEPDMGLERLAFFSDAVMAIAMTLLALEIKLPNPGAALSSAALLEQLLALLPKYLGFVVSFLVVGLFWIAHNRQFRNLRRYDYALIWLNFLYLLLIAFLPFPTSVVSEHANAASTIFYAGEVAAIGLSMQLILWYTSRRPHLLRQRLTGAQFRTTFYRQLVAPLIFLISIPIALWNPAVARLAWAATAATFFFHLEEVPPQE
jgi:uncharacterized membrane protein